jgi:hypothetical protein
MKWKPAVKRVFGVLSPGDIAAGCKADYSLPSSADIKNGGDITPFPYTSSLHGA